MRGLVFALLLVLGLPFVALAQTGTIQGRITDQDGSPIAGATVSLEGTGLGTQTDGQGDYVLRGVSAGSYTLLVEAVGHATESESVTVAEGAEVRRDYALRSEAIQVETLRVFVGSRAQHSAADELAVPVDVYTSEQIASHATPETSAILEELSPSVNFPRQSVTDATDIVRPFTLRGLSPDHTLVLVNGKRRHHSALVHIFGAGMGAGSSGVDLNALPASMIDRIEVLRDGAAAQYGSDAIAGVVNMVTKSGAFPLTIGATTGRYYPGDFDADGTIRDVSGAIGLPLGNGSVGLFAEWRDRNATNRAGADPEDQIVEGDADIVDDEGNVIEKNNPVDQPNHHWGDGNQEDILTFADLRIPVTADELTQLYAFGGYSFREGDGQGFRRQGISDRNWPEIYPLGFLPTFDADVVDASASGGVRGVAAGWVWDAGLTWGHNAFEYNLTNTLNVSLGPCLDTPCAPGLDGILGNADDPGIPNQTEFFAGELSLNEVTAGIDVAREWGAGFLASPLHLALGAAWRHENYKIEPGEEASFLQGGHPNRNGDPAPPGSQVFTGFSVPVDEGRSNVGVYADLEASLTSQFLANMAARFESYSDFGEKLTGKLALRFQPTRQFVLRGAVSTGFRAPALSQQFYQSTVTNFMQGEGGEPVAFEAGIFPVEHPAAVALGAEPLDEETSVNVSGGLAVTPVDRLTFTADFFFITIDDRIILTSEVSGEEIEEILDEAGVPDVQAARFFTNGLDTETRGIDLTARYVVPAGPGTLDLSAVYNWTENEVTQTRTPPELEGTGAELFSPFLEGGLIELERGRPEWRSTFEGLWSDERLSLLGRVSFWGPFTSVLLGICGEACVQEYDSKTLVDAEAGYRFGERFLVAAGARNLLDEFPDRAIFDNSFGIFNFPSASPYGFNGRYLYVRTEIEVPW
ncbi:MAG TPA: TonB-dependent receptor [Gemmatimonadota bacterium]|nr:TonB-dependent receptor [Gemmatimonadota bacterium]